MRSVLIIFILSFVCCVYGYGQVKTDTTAIVLTDSSKQEPVVPVRVKKKKRGKRPPVVYFHAIGGVGLALAFSEDIEEIFDNQLDLKGSLIGQYGARFGIGNIAQFQYFRSDGSHNLTANRARLELDFNTEEYMVKFNPKVWEWFTRGSGESVLYIVAGLGELDWVDDSDDGFFGEIFSLGVEYAFVREAVSASVGLKRKQLNIDTIILSNELFDFDAKGSQWVMDLTIGIGFGK